MGPIDYTASFRNRPDPMAKLLQGLKVGAAFGELEQASKQREQQEQYKIDATEVFKNPSHEKISGLMIKYPKMGEKIKAAHDVLTAPQKQREVQDTQKVYSALSNGRSDIAIEMLDEKITAHENSGEDATKFKKIKSMIERDPKSATSFIGMSLASMMGEKDFSKTFKALGEERRAEISAPIKLKKENAEIVKLATDLDLSKAKINKVLAENKKLAFDTKKTIVELEALEKGADQIIVDPEKRFKAERELRQENTTRTKNITIAKDAFNKLSASAKDGTGAGDTALVFSFMKMLDPGSVVRESEFALAQDTAGLLARLQNTAEKVQTGQFLTSKQRGDFVRLAKKYMQSAEDQEKIVKKSLEKVVKNYKLNAENVFLVEDEEIDIVDDEAIIDSTQSTDKFKNIKKTIQKNVVVDF